MGIPGRYYLHVGVISKVDFRLKSNLEPLGLAFQPPFLAHAIHCVAVDAIDPGERYLLTEIPET